jgi:hypothetical protein
MNLSHEDVNDVLENSLMVQTGWRRNRFRDETLRSKLHRWICDDAGFYQTLS